MYFTHKVNIYDLNLELICWNSFTDKSKAEKYAKNLRAEHLKHVGKIEVVPHYVQT